MRAKVKTSGKIITGFENIIEHLKQQVREGTLPKIAFLFLMWGRFHGKVLGKDDFLPDEFIEEFDDLDDDDSMREYYLKREISLKGSSSDEGVISVN